MDILQLDFEDVLQETCNITLTLTAWNSYFDTQQAHHLFPPPLSGRLPKRQVNGPRLHCTCLGTINVPMIIGWIAIKFGTDIHGAQRMNYDDFGDQSLHLSGELSQHLLDELAQNSVQKIIVLR